MISTEDWDPPPWVRIPSLEEALGCPPREITWSTLQRLVKARRVESAVLDFKQWFYDWSKPESEIAKDVVAFANAAGGLIILGIKEDDESRAVDLNRLKVDEHELDAMSSHILEKTAPFVQGVTVGTVVNPDDPGHCAYLVLVPPSSTAPHGVRREKDAYAWPVRYDRKTRWMTEQEIALRYRDRFAEATGRLERLTTVAEEGIQRLERTHQPWLSVGCVAESPARVTHSREDDQHWLAGHFMQRPWGFSSNHGIGRRRTIFTSETPSDGLSTGHHFELHRDGSTFAAVGLPVVKIQEPGRPPSKVVADQPVEVGDLTEGVVRLMDLVIHYSIARGVSGDLLVRVQLNPGLIDAATARMAGIGRLVQPLIGAERYSTIHNASEWKAIRQVHRTQSLSDPTPVELTVPLTLGVSRSDLLRVAAEVVDELMAEFGQPPAHPPLQRDGSIDHSSPSESARDVIAGWLNEVARDG